jgi:hypothetical protein
MTLSCTAAPNKRRSSEWEQLHGTILAYQILKQLLEFLKKLCSPAQAYVPTVSKWTYTSGLKQKSTKVKYNSEYINCIGVPSVNSYSSVIFAFIYYRYKFLI